MISMTPMIGRRWSFAAVLALAAAPALEGQDGQAPVLHESAANEIEIPFEQIAPELQAAFAEAMANLLAQDWSLREDAEEWLEHSAVPDAVFEAMLQAGTLAPEQEHRILAVLRDRILGRERGAMGIKMTTGRSPVQVIEVRPNMPAWGRLEVGDTILAIDGIPIAISDDLETVLAERRPGQEIDVTVRRRKAGGNPALNPLEEETLTIRMELTDDSQFTEEEQAARRQDRILRARDFVLRYSPRQPPLRAPAGDTNRGESDELVTLRRQMVEYATADADDRRALREEWRATRDALLVATLASGISDAERQRRWELYSAYVELLPPGVD